MSSEELNQPELLTCCGCKADLGVSGVEVWEHIGTGPMHGVLEPGIGEDGVILRVQKMDTYHVDIQCGECHASQPQLVLEDWYLDPEARIDDEEGD